MRGRTQESRHAATTAGARHHCYPGSDTDARPPPSSVCLSPSLIAPLHPSAHLDSPPMTDSQVRVVVRIRPLLAHEPASSGSAAKGRGVHACKSPDGAPAVLLRDDVHEAASAQSSGAGCAETLFTFDGVYEASSTNTQLFDAEVGPHLPRLFTGASVTLFAFGMTGTGQNTRRGNCVGRHAADCAAHPTREQAHSRWLVLFRCCACGLSSVSWLPACSPLFLRVLFCLAAHVPFSQAKVIPCRAPRPIQA